MSIEIAQKCDANQLIRLENSLFDKSSFALSKEAFLYHIKRENIIKLSSDQVLAGYLLYLTRKNSHKLRIYSLAVSKEFQNMGYAKRLLEEVIKIAEKRGKKSLYLEVNIENKNAIKLYQKVGFKVTKTLKSYYQNSDGLQMELSI